MYCILAILKISLEVSLKMLFSINLILLDIIIMHITYLIYIWYILIIYEILKMECGQQNVRIGWERLDWQKRCRVAEEHKGLTYTPSC